MPEHLRSFLVVFVVSVAVFLAARRSLAPLMPAGAYARRRNLWLGVTFVAFVPANFWAFMCAAALMVLWANRRESHPGVLFLALLFCLPPFAADIPGFGLVNYLFSLNVQRLLSLAVFGPAAFVLWRRSQRVAGTRWPDRILLLYLLVLTGLYAREGSVTSTLRDVFLLLVEVGLPYYVLSRGLSHLSGLKDALAAVVLGALVVALLAVIEAGKHWLLYQSLARAWGVSEGISTYLSRGGLLRVRVTAGHAIALGYVMMVALALYSFVGKQIQGSVPRRLGWLVLLAGLAAPLSRGPWVGAVVAMVGFLITGHRPLRAIVVGLLPFVGDVDKSNIDYREKLLRNSVLLLEEHPWFGPPDYQAQLAKMGMVQGEGIVDIVNTYVQVALSSGLVGLALFSGFFAALIFSLRKAMKEVIARGAAVDSDLYLLGRSLMAALLGTLATIGTVSSITVIPWTYWSVAALGVAYIRMTAMQAQQQKEGLRSDAGMAAPLRPPAHPEASRRAPPHPGGHRLCP
jgi:hypothetical protein